jgi:hypothetical protein
LPNQGYNKLHLDTNDLDANTYLNFLTRMNPTSGVRQQYTDPAALVHLNIQGFTFGHIYYTLLNTPEVQASNYTEGVRPNLHI